MSETNDKTICAYEEGVLEYIKNTHSTVEGSLKIWIDWALSFLKPNSSILEIGSGNGRDAKYMEERGFKVTRSDAVQGFVNYLQGQGYEAEVLNALQDSLPIGFDMIFADAVFLHFTPKELDGVLEKIHSSLGKGGILAFMLKEGEGSEWSSEKIGSGRFFHYWDPGDLADFVHDAGFTLMRLVRDTVGTTKWIFIIAEAK